MRAHWDWAAHGEVANAKRIMVNIGAGGARCFLDYLKPGASRDALQRELDRHTAVVRFRKTMKRYESRARRAGLRDLERCLRETRTRMLTVPCASACRGGRCGCPTERFLHALAADAVGRLRASLGDDAQERSATAAASEGE